MEIEPVKESWRTEFPFKQSEMIKLQMRGQMNGRGEKRNRRERAGSDAPCLIYPD